MTEYTPTMDRLRREYIEMREARFGFSDLYAAEWDRALAAHDAEVRAQGHHVVPCAQCGQKPVVANDALNSDIVVCGDCGVQIGLHELPEVRASVVPEEPEGEYGVRDARGRIWRTATAGARDGDVAVRRRKAGKWLPAEQEKP